jgi:separase
MALRDTKTGQQQVTGDALLVLLQAPDSSGLASQLKLYVAPVNTVGAGGKENRSAAEWHACAKQYVPFLVKLLKLCTAEVARPPRGENDTAVWKKGDEVFAAMAIALDTLHLLRSFLVGCAFEIEIQRSGLVRRLMAWKKFAVALEQSRKNYLSLCCNVLAPTTKQGGPMVAAIKGKASARQRRVLPTATTKKAAGETLEQELALRPPHEVEMVAGLPALVTGVVVDLIWCSGETGADSPECFQKLAILPQQLDPWLRMLDAGVIEGQRDALFRALHKCASLLVANPALYGAELVEKFCLLTLQQLCNSPALCPQYAKVAWKLSSHLSCQGANFTRIALNVCEVAMEDILLRCELQCLSGSTDVLDLIDGYARLCLTANEGLQGWLHICQFVERCGQEFRLLAPAAGFYSVGLMLLIEETSEMEMKAGHLSNDRGCNNPQEKIHSACELLHAGAEAVENWLQQDIIPSSWPPFIEGGSGGNRGTQASKGVLGKTGVVAVEANHLLSALKAVDFIRRHSATYVQHEWTSFLSIAGSKGSEEGRNLTQSASFNSALQKVLCLCIPLLERCETLTCDEYLKKGWSMTSASMIAAFRLSLVHQQQQEIQTCITSINTLVSTSRLKPDDLHWLTSSIYNMGVHIFNTKLYKLACFPFEVANNIVWTRVSSNLTQLSEVAESMGQNSILRDLVSEGCAKCLTLADTLARSGQHTVGLGVLVAGITRWAMVQTAVKPPGLKIPQVLVRSLVKMMHTESVLAEKLVTLDPPCLYTFLGSNLRHFQPRTLGLLMEEEMSALEELEASNLSYFQSTMERQLHLLLNNVYTAEEFPVERSRALQEKGRIARSRGNDGLATCVSCIIEAESVVNAALKDSQRTSSAVLQVASLEDQLATIYCIQALCAYETNPSGQDYIEKIVAALKLWKQSLEAQKKWSLLCTEDNAVSDCQEAGNGAASVGLLMNIFDLLSLKGFSPLQCEIQGLILEMTSVSQVHCSHEELCAVLWANCRLGHVLCPVPFPAGFFSLVSQKLEVAGDSLMFWQNSALHCQGSLLDARQKLISQDFLDGSCTNDGNCTEAVSGSSEFLENIALSQFSTGRRNTHEALGLAGLFCLLADHEYGKGDIREAMKYAKKGLSLRLRAFTHAFVMVDKGMSCLNTEDSQSSPQSDGAEKNKVGRLEALGSAAITNWPRFTSSAKPVKFGPSQWRILGDYIESLMQVGVIHERMGAVDDAERSFREGQRLSLAHDMLLAQAAFSSCLGEVHRKRHLWELAESELCLARKIYDELDSGLVCGHCNLAGQALLALRFGDLARRRSDSNPIASQNLESDLDCFAEPSLMTWNDAKSCYKTSRDILGVLLSMPSVKCPCTKSLLVATTEALPCNLLRIYPQIPAASSIASTASGDNVLAESICSGQVGSRLQDTVEKGRAWRSVLSSSSKGHVCEEQDIQLVQSDVLPHAEPEPARRRGLRPKKTQGNTENPTDEKQPTRRRKPKTQRPVTGGMTDSAKVQANADDKALVGVKGTRRRMFLDTMNKMGNLALEERALEQKLSLVEPERKSRDICDFNGQKHPQNVPSQEDNLLCNHRLQAPSSMQSWTEYVWVKHCHQLLARLIIQTGKLEQGFGSTEKAAEMYLRAKCVLGISLEPLSATTSCSDLPQDFFSSIQARKSPYPLEEAALLYHMSLLYLQRTQHSRSQGCDVGSFLPLAWLYQAFQLCSQIPPLLRKVARLLSLLHVPIVRGNFGLCRQDNMSGLKEQAAFFHQVSVGAGVQQQHLAVLDTRLAGLLSETDKALHYGSLKCCLQQMQQALSVPRLTIDTMQTAVRDMMKGMPCSTLCCISMVDSEHGFLLDKEQTDDAVDSVVGPAWLLLTRLSNSSGPLTVVLPVTSIVEDTSSNEGSGSQEGQTSCPYDLDNSDAKPDQMQLQVGGSKTSNQMCLQRLVSGFQSILEESRQSTSGLLPLTAIENKSQWWQWRIQLDARLESLLRTMEDTWLGPWKCLFLGEPDATAILKEFQSNALELCSLLRSTSRARQEDGVEVPVDENQVQLLLQGVGTIKEKELELGIASILGWSPALFISSSHLTDDSQCAHESSQVQRQLISEVVKAFNVAYRNSIRGHRAVLEQLGVGSDTNVGGRRNARKCRETSAKETVVVERPSAPRGLSKVGDTDKCEFERQAMTLILDAGLQSLPWESLPVLRGHTTYRMPSLGSTCALTIHQQYVAAAAMANPQICHGAQVGNTHADPLAGCPDQVTMQQVATIDLSSTYYLLNPSGDLEKTQCAFEDWFKQQQGWEGKAGQVPTVEEYMKALQKHDLFVYLGHGSGDQYLPERYIRTLDRCAAALLMGCSSGRLSPRGDYEPAGVPLSYLIASCPAAIANLWDVTDGDIDRFSRFLLHKWLNIDQPPLPPLVNDSLMKAVPTRLKSKSSEAALREMPQEQFTAKSGELPHARRNTKATERKLEFGIQQAEETRPRMVMCTAVGEARNSCRLPYLIGASPVYYGVPTSIQKSV